MWYRLPPRLWFSLVRQFQDHPKPYAKEVSGELETLRSGVPPESFSHHQFAYGSITSIAESPTDVWMVVLPGNALIGGGWTFVMRATDGRFLAVYLVRGE
jgi:hypothetical protein